jgi:hypothetical protein
MKIDGRKVAHDKLEQIRIGAVQLVQQGKTPTDAYSADREQ